MFAYYQLHIKVRCRWDYTRKNKQQHRNIIEGSNSQKLVGIISEIGAWNFNCLKLAQSSLAIGFYAKETHNNNVIIVHFIKV